jgi:hypothetical protein
MGQHGAVVRIEGWDAHLYWEIDFVGMKATRWMEQSRGWQQEQFPLRRRSGTWEILLQPAAWRRFDDEVASQLEALWERHTAN